MKLFKGDKKLHVDCRLSSKRDTKKNPVMQKKCLPVATLSLSLCLVTYCKSTQLVSVVISLTGPILDLTRVLLSCLSELQGCLIMEWSIDLKMFISSIQICAVPFCYQGFFFPRTKFRE